MYCQIISFLHYCTQTKQVVHLYLCLDIHQHHKFCFHTNKHPPPTVSPGGNKPMCVFYHTCVVKTQHLPVCYFHICVVISTHMCERAHMCGKNHTSCPRVVCGVYHTCVGKTFVLCFFETFPITFFSYDS